MLIYQRVIGKSHIFSINVQFFIVREHLQETLPFPMHFSRRSCKFSLNRMSFWNDLCRMPNFLASPPRHLPKGPGRAINVGNELGPSIPIKMANTSIIKLPVTTSDPVFVYSQNGSKVSNHEANYSSLKNSNGTSL